MVTSFKTIKTISEGSFKEKGSKFLAFAYPVSNVTQVDQYLKELRKRYHDARHHCYAYILGPDAAEKRANDDGEPGHSAGDPILGQIKSHELTNTLIVVVRYFGGTKLGVSGLINAYKTAAIEALEHNKILVQKVTKQLRLLFPYPSINEVMKLIGEMNIHITAQSFDNDCEISGTVDLDYQQKLDQKIELLKNLGIKITLMYN